VNDRRDSIEEGKRVLALSLGDGVGQRRRGFVSGGDDDAVPKSEGGQSGNFFAADLDQRLRGGMSAAVTADGKSVAIHGQRAAGRNLVGVAFRMQASTNRRIS